MGLIRFDPGILDRDLHGGLRRYSGKDEWREVSDVRRFMVDDVAKRKEKG